MQLRKKYFTLFGLLLDIIGGVLIAISIIFERNTSWTNYKSLQELETKLQEEQRKEFYITEIGIGFLVAGFLVLFISEAVF